MFRYHTGQDTEIIDPMVKLAFGFLQQTFDRDNSKYEAIREARKHVGKLGGEAKAGSAKNPANVANANFAKQDPANLAVNVNESGNVNDSESDNERYLTSFAPCDADLAQSLQEEVLKGKKKILTGKRTEAFNRFWQAFAYKKDKAQAIDAWASIPKLTGSLVDTICLAAERETERLPELIAAGRTPIYAQGWISGRRWKMKNKQRQRCWGLRFYDMTCCRKSFAHPQTPP